jgi:hypothetical protein
MMTEGRNHLLRNVSLCMLNLAEKKFYEIVN